jgi:hypothetical protein
MVRLSKTTPHANEDLVRILEAYHGGKCRRLGQAIHAQLASKLQWYLQKGHLGTTFAFREIFTIAPAAPARWTGAPAWSGRAWPGSVPGLPARSVPGLPASPPSRPPSPRLSGVSIWLGMLNGDGPGERELA